DLKHNRDVAIKVLRPELAALIGAERFLAEIETTAQLQHPHILPLYDSGDADGHLYYVMPYVEGETLAERLARERQLPVDEAVRIGAEVADALDYAHRHGPPHTGSSLQAVIASVLTKAPPPVDEDRTSIPAELAAVVHRAVERLPADRFQSAAELANALRNPSPFTRRGAVARAGGSRLSRSTERAVWVGLAVVLVAFTAVLARRDTPGDGASQPGFRFQVPAPYVRFTTPGTRLALSRDGRTLAYVAPGGPRRYEALYTRDLSTLEPSYVSDATEGAITPEFSPDGRSVFALNMTLLDAGVVDLSWGVVTASWSFEEGSTAGSAHWTDDGYIYIALLRGIFRLPEDGGPPEQVAVTEGEDLGFDLIPTSPFRLPEGRGFLYSALNFDASVSDLWVYDAESRENRPILTGAGHPEYLAMGAIVYQTPQGRLDGVAFDLESLEIVGEPRPLVADIGWNEEGGRAYSVSDNGVLAYDQITSEGVELVWVDQEGASTAVAGGLPRDIRDVAISPEGSRIAIDAVVGGTEDIYLLDLEQGTQTRLTTGGGLNQRPTWLPGGDRVAFVSDRTGGVRAVYSRPVDASAPAELLVMRERLVQQVTWRGDGTYVFREGYTDSLTQRDLLYRSLGDTASRPFIVSEFDELAPEFSPDGNWVAYLSTEGGRDEIYVRPFPGPGGRVAISADGGTEASWAPDGNTIYYRSRRDSLVAARLSFEGGSIQVRARTNLFSTSRYALERNDRAYDVHPDGRRFLFIRQPETSNLVVVTDWFAEVRQILGLEDR
ncbi:MAG: protein kinase, partial [Gemmatimonadota bacterium]